MSNIMKELENILKARFGKDVRQAIHNAIHQCYEDGKAGSLDLIARESIESLQDDVSKLNADAISLDSSVKTIDSRVDLLDIKKSIDSTLRNTKHGGLRLTKMQGNTEQKKLSGKNLLDSSNVFADGTYYSCSNEKCKILQEDTRVWSNSALPTLTLEPNTEYTLSVQNACWLYIGMDKAFHKTLKNVNSITFTTSSTGIVEFKLLADSYPFDVGYVQLEKGSVATEYEEYCGGTPSPNPNFPQPLMNVSDCVEMIQGYYTDTGVLTNNAISVCSKNKIPCKSGDVIKVTTELTDLQAIYVKYYNDSGFVSRSGITSGKEIESVAPSGATYFLFNVSSNTDITPDTVGKITLTINGKYVGCAKLLKELFDGESEEATYNTSTGAKNGTKGWCCAKNPIPCKKGERITIKHNFDVNLFRLFFYKTDGTFVNYKQSGENATGFETVADNDGYFIWCILDDIVISPSTLGELSIKGSMSGTVAHFLTNEPMRKGDVLFKEDGLFKVERKSMEVVYDGSSDEAWAWFSDKALAYIRPNNVKKNSETLCDKYTTYTYVDNNSYQYGVSINVLGDLCIKDDNNFTSLATFKTFIVDNPLTVQYELATPTIEVLDTESQINLNKLETFDTVTYIEVDSRVKPLGIEAEYGTSQVGAYTLKSLLNSESNAVKIEDAISTMLLVGA